MIPGLIVSNKLKIVEVNEKSLTFAVPPGQRKYSRHMFESGMSGDANPEAIAITSDGDEQPPTGVDNKPGAIQIITDTETSSHEAPETSEKGEGALVEEKTAENGNPPDSSKTREAEIAVEEKADENDATEDVTPDIPEAVDPSKPPGEEIRGATASKGGNTDGTSSQTDGGHSSTSAEQEEDTLHTISMLTQLEKKIVEIDGHFNSNDLAVANTWKSFRGIRNNQDLGTLFEMREEFYVYKHPQIVKEGKKRR